MYICGDLRLFSSRQFLGYKVYFALWRIILYEELYIALHTHRNKLIESRNIAVLYK